jgi:hypothetical protein
VVFVFGCSGFSFLVVAVPPSYFNNNHRKQPQVAFWRQRRGHVAVACMTIPQAEPKQSQKKQLLPVERKLLLCQLPPIKTTKDSINNSLKNE